jgi:hypothetical protein
LTEILSAVLRLSEISISRSELENHLGILLERYESDKAYAQLDAGESWGSISTTLAAYGDIVARLKQEGVLQKACLDIAFSFFDDMASTTCQIPYGILYDAGRNQIDINVSVYLTCRD